MGLIESAYEQDSQFAEGVGCTSMQANDAAELYDNIYDDKELMIAICNNIITNEGTFKV